MKPCKLIAALLSVLAISAHAQTAFQPDPKGIQYLKRLVAEDFHTYLDGGTALLDYGLRRPDVRLTAHELSIAYIRDPQSADAVYKGKWVLFGGGIRSGGTGSDGHPYLDIAGTQESYSDVRAKFDGGINYLDSAPVNLLCQSAGHQGGHPLLTHCADYYHPDNFDPATQLLPNYINNQISDWFGEGKVPTIGRKDLFSLFAFYWAGTHLPPYSPGDTGRSQEEQLMMYLQLAKDRDPSFVAAYNQAKATLHLPPLHGTTQ